MLSEITGIIKNRTISPFGANSTVMTKKELSIYGRHSEIIEEFTSPTFPDLTVRLSDLFRYLV